MSIQAIINSAQTIEVSRPALVASTMSRSGRLFTGTRNWTKPWRFTVSPKPIWRISEARGVIEDIMTADKHTEQTVNLGQGGAAWCINYLGDAPRTGNQLNTITISSITGTMVVIGNLSGLTDGQYIFRKGDIMQPVGHRYPYVVVEDVQFATGDTTKTFTVHRGYIPQTSYTMVGANILVGSGVSWRVKVSSLPAYRYVSGQLVEFTGEFELVESII